VQGEDKRSQTKTAKSTTPDSTIDPPSKNPPATTRKHEPEPTCHITTKGIGDALLRAHQQRQR